jgi:MtN3 and saliva related transmembrane protein
MRSRRRYTCYIKPMTTIDILGYIAASLTTVSFLPQALGSVRTGRTDGLSLPMYALFSAGVALWLAYGVAVQSWPVILANLVTLGFAIVILTLIIRNRRRSISARDRVRALVVGD